MNPLKTLGNFLKRLDLIILIVITLTGILIVIIDTFDIVKSELFDDVNYWKFSFIILSLIAFHLAYRFKENQDFREKTMNEINNVIKSLKGVKVIEFANSEEMETYLGKRLLEAKIEICDLSWKEKLSRRYSLVTRKKSRKSYDNSIAKISKSVLYREIFIFTDDRRKEKLKKRIIENYPGYSCSYFENSGDIPRLQFVLIDRHEIIFASSSYPKLCAIQHKDLGAIFQAYYNQTWEKATPVIEGVNIIEREVSKILGANWKQNFK